MTRYRSTKYGPFERGRTYTLEFRARYLHRGVVVNRDLSAAQLELRLRMYTPTDVGAMLAGDWIVDVVGVKLPEDGSADGATGLWSATFTIAKDAPLGTCVFELVAVDTAVNDANTYSTKREIALADPAQSSVVRAPTS